MESHNGRMWDKLPSQRSRRSTAEAHDAVEVLRQNPDEVGPHRADDNKTPSEFARRYTEILNSQRLVS